MVWHKIPRAIALQALLHWIKVLGWIAADIDRVCKESSINFNNQKRLKIINLNKEDRNIKCR